MHAIFSVVGAVRGRLHQTLVLFVSTYRGNASLAIAYCGNSGENQCVTSCK